MLFTRSIHNWDFIYSQYCLFDGRRNVFKITKTSLCALTQPHRPQRDREDWEHSQTFTVSCHMSLGNSPVDEAVLNLAWGPDFSILLSLSSICVSVQLMLFLSDSWVWSHFLRHLLGLSSIDGTISSHTCCLNLFAAFLFFDQPTSEGFWPELHPGPCCHVFRWTYLASTCAVVVSWRSSTSSSLCRSSHLN